MPEHGADVIIIGAGPVGLASAILLGQAGVRTLVVERKPAATGHPRAFGVHGRTMEIFRQWGIADEIRAGALPPERSIGFGWFSSLVGAEIGSLTFGDPGQSAGEAEPSPEPPCFCPQHHYEQVLLATARSHPSVQVLFQHEAVGLRQDGDGVEVELAHPESAASETVRGQYLVAADGAHSQVRQWLGAREYGLSPFGHSVHTHFRADLTPYVADKPYMLMWVLNRATQGTLAVASRDYQEWTYNFAAPASQDISADEIARQIRAAVGVPGLTLEILDVLRWDYEQKVSEPWRVGRAFLVGDAAHRFPPHGAFGMNSGVQDAQNLMWKLALVLQGLAEDSLLSTYELERKPVAEVNGEQSVRNTRNLDLVSGAALGTGELDDLVGGEVAARDAFRSAIARQAAHLQSTGQQFGVRYESSAVLPDGAQVPESTIADYAESGAPGARAPHLWLRGADGSEISTIDLFGGGFVLLAADQRDRWIQAAQQSSHARSVHVKVHQIGPGRAWRELSRRFTSVYGLTSEGAVLVRPDGHVLARFSGGVDEPEAVLDAALVQVLTGATQPTGASRGSDSE